MARMRSGCGASGTKAMLRCEEKSVQFRTVALAFSTGPNAFISQFVTERQRKAAVIELKLRSRRGEKASWVRGSRPGHPTEPARSIRLALFPRRWFAPR